MAPLFGEEKRAGDLGVTLLAFEDPYFTDVENGHTTDAFRAGLERFVAIEVLLRSYSRTENLSFSSSKFHLFDDGNYLREAVGLDSRVKKPVLVESFLTPGGVVRGWVTFILPWERQAASVQFFTGYLSAKIAPFALPMVDAATLERNRAAYRARLGQKVAAHTLAEREAETKALEARAEIAKGLLEQEQKILELEARAAKAREVIARAEDLERRLDSIDDE